MTEIVQNRSDPGVGLAGYWTALVGSVALASHRKGSGSVAGDEGAMARPVVRPGGPGWPIHRGLDLTAMMKMKS